MAKNVKEQACWLLLVFKSGLPSRVVNDIIAVWCKQAGRTLEEFIAAGPQGWNAIGSLSAETIKKLEQARIHLTEQEVLVEQLARSGIQVVTAVNDHYPKLLKLAVEPDQLPPVLCYAGNLNVLDRMTIALIGSRNAAELSLTFTQEVAKYLAEHDVNIISGNARGVDRAAYEGATSTDGCTTVVLPHGIRKLSKAQMRDLRPRIASGKVLVLSQFHPDASWFVSRAMERNKMVTGLAQVVIVAEANTSGGTWNAAINALERKQPLYVYQTANTPLSAGNDALIERGARPLYWYAEDQPPMDVVLSPLLQQSELLYQLKKCQLSLAHQLLKLLKEHGATYDHP